MSALAKIKKTAAQHEQVREYDKALALYARVLDDAAGEDEVDIGLYNRAGDLAIRTGDSARGIAYFERALDLYAAGGFLNNAVALGVKILRHAPGHLSAHYTLGVLYARKGFRSEARQHLLTYAEQMHRAGRVDEASRALGELGALCTTPAEVRATLDALASRTADVEQGAALTALFQRLVGAVAETGAERRAAEAPVDRAAEAPNGRDALGPLVFLDLADVADFPAVAEQVVERAHATHVASETPAAPVAPVDAATREVVGTGTLPGELPPLTVAGLRAPRAEPQGGAAIDQRPAPDLLDVVDVEVPDGTTASLDLALDRGTTEFVADERSLDVLSIDTLSAESPRALVDVPNVDGLLIDDDYLPTAVGAVATTAATSVELVPAALDAGLASDADDELFVLDLSESAHTFEPSQPADAGGVVFLDFADEPARPDEGAFVGDSTAALESDVAFLDLDDSLDAGAEFADVREASAIVDLDEAFEPIARSDSDDHLVDATATLADDAPAAEPSASVRAELTSIGAVVAPQPAPAPSPVARADAGAALFVDAFDPLDPDGPLAGDVFTTNPVASAGPASADLDIVDVTHDDVMPPVIGAPAMESIVDDTIDLGAWLRESTPAPSTRMTAPVAPQTGDEQADFQTALDSFTAGIRRNVDVEDYDSHYDLGIAFREMGLLDEAVGQLQQAARAPGRPIRALEALAHCFLDMGHPELALTTLERAADEASCTGTPEAALVGVHYLLGVAATQVGRAGDARGWLVRVLAADYDFRDAAARLAALPSAAPPHALPVAPTR